MTKARVPFEPWKITKAKLMEYYPYDYILDPGKVRELHKKAVAEAIREGKPVPKKVLKDYPDLKGGK